MRISDGSSDVCSSDLPVSVVAGRPQFFDRAIDVEVAPAGDGPARLDFRPHDVSVCGEGAGCLPVLVTGVYRRGGDWRIEGEVARSEERRGGKELVSTCRTRGSPDP